MQGYVLFPKTAYHYGLQGAIRPNLTQKLKQFGYEFTFDIQVQNNTTLPTLQYKNTDRVMFLYLFSENLMFLYF